MPNTFCKTILILLLLTAGQLSMQGSTPVYTLAADSSLNYTPSKLHPAEAETFFELLNAHEKTAFSNDALVARFSIFNPSKERATYWVGFSISNEYSHIFADGKLLRNGAFVDRSERKHPQNGITPVEVGPGQKIELMVLMANRTNRPVSHEYTHLYGNNTVLEQLSNPSPKIFTGHAIAVFFQGAVWIMMIYMLLLFVQNQKEYMYLFYALYMFFAMYYMFQKLEEVYPISSLMPFTPEVRWVLNEPLQFFIYLFYNAFVVSFLNVYSKDRFLYRVIRVLNISYLVYAFAVLLYLFFTYDAILRDTLFVITRILIIAISIFLIIRFLTKVRGVLTRYIVVGSIFFMVGNMLAMAYSLQLPLPEIPFYPINFTQMGIFAELICFSLGLGHRIRLQARERENLQEAYIQQLVMNETIARDSNRKLQQTVAARTEEVLRKQKEIDEARSAEIEEKFQRQLTEIEMEALRLQMNPHFLFNSLNSIRYYVMQEDSEKAADYITKFSKLLRNILQNNRQRTIRLSQEMETLQLYMAFEKERLSGRFDFHLEIDEFVNLEEIEIQPMLIQPFVENAIWHGINHKEGKGSVWIRVSMVSPDKLKIEIEDNGVGREKASAINSGSVGKNSSVGLTNTQERLKLMSKLQKIALELSIEDLKDERSVPSGTRVTLTLAI